MIHWPLLQISRIIPSLPPINTITAIDESQSVAGNFSPEGEDEAEVDSEDEDEAEVDSEDEDEAEVDSEDEDEKDEDEAEVDSEDEDEKDEDEAEVDSEDKDDSNMTISKLLKVSNTLIMANAKLIMTETHQAQDKDSESKPKTPENLKGKLRFFEKVPKGYSHSCS